MFMNNLNTWKIKRKISPLDFDTTYFHYRDIHRYAAGIGTSILRSYF